MKTKHFKISEVLQWQPQKEIAPLKINELTVEGDYSYPFYGQATANNGIISFQTLTPKVLNNKDGKPTILIHSNNQNIVYLETPFYLKDGHGATSVLQSERLNEKNALYIITCIKKVIKKKFAYNEKATKIALKNTYIELPVNAFDEIDYEFMEERVRELEEECVRELEEECVRELSTYLTVAGLDNYILTKKEKNLLSTKVLTKQVQLKSIFESDTGDVDLQQKDIDGKGEFFINSGIQNYGIKGKTSRKAKIFPANTITVDFFGYAFYRPFPYKMATHNHVFSLSGSIIKNEKVGLYLVSLMSYFPKRFSFNEMATWNKIKELTLDIPITESGEYDYKYMESYITIQEKRAIKNVIEWKDRIINKTKQAI